MGTTMLILAHGGTQWPGKLGRSSSPAPGSEHPRATHGSLADAASAEIVEEGGTILTEPFDIPVGRVAVVSDPFGNVLVLVDLTKGRYVTDAGRVTGVRFDAPLRGEA